MKKPLIQWALFLLTGWLLLAVPRAEAKLLCTMTASNIDFGILSPLAGDTDVNSTLSITCTAATTDIPGGDGGTRDANICISFDTGTGGTGANPRQLANTANSGLKANFDLYTTHGHSTVWLNRNGTPSGTPPTITVTMTQNGGNGGNGGNSGNGGNGGNGGNSGNGSGTVNQTAISPLLPMIFGRLPGGQNAVPPGTYLSVFTNQPIQAWWAKATGSGNVKTDCSPGGSPPESSSSFNMTVTATFVGACQTLTAGALTFPSTGSLASSVDSTSIIDIQCSIATPYKIGLNAGLGAGATTSNRKMTGPGNKTINYQLYRDSAHTLNWGNDTIVGTDTNNGIGTGSRQSYTVYGRVLPQTTPPSGSYTDAVTVTVVY